MSSKLERSRSGQHYQTEEIARTITLVRLGSERQGETTKEERNERKKKKKE